MDDIASKLGVSKKTLYRYVKNKEDLVGRVIDYFIEQQQQMILMIVKDKQFNAIQAFVEINKNFGNHLKQTHPSVIFDIQKYYPSAWQKMRSFKMDFIFNIVAENINKGIAEGLYRNNINAEIVAFLYVTMADNLFNVNQLAEKYLLNQLHIELVRYHVRGIANEKGIKYLQEILNKNEDEEI